MFSKLNTIFKKKSKRYYFLQAVCFVALLFLCDFLLGKTLQKLYYRQSSGWEWRTITAVENIKADIMIFGASRAQQQYNPTYIEDSLNKTCFNVGRDGMPIFYHYAILKSILKRHTPQVIILDCEYGVLKKAESSYERLSCLLPFYKGHPEMQDIIALRGPYEKYKLWSYTYPYNSLLFKIAMGNIKSQKKRIVDIKGYVPLYNVLDEPIKTIDYSKEYELDSVKINILKLFIDDCKKQQIKLFLACSPYYNISIDTDYSIKIIKEIAKEKNIEFLDYTKEKIFLQNSKLFDDTVHVNTTGSKIFSSMVASDLKKRLLSK